MPEIQFAIFSVSDKGHLRRLTAPTLVVAITTNESRPEASPELQGAVMYNQTVGQLQVCVGDRWRTVTL